MKKERPIGKTYSIQSWLPSSLDSRPERTEITRFFGEQLEGVDTLLGGSHLESMAMDFAVMGFEEASVRDSGLAGGSH